MTVKRDGLITAIFVFLFVFTALQGLGAPTELFLRGYSVVPTPRNVELSEQDIVIDGSWTWVADGLKADHIAARSLVQGLESLHLSDIHQGSSANRVIRLAVREGTVKVGAPRDPGIVPQAYRLSISPSQIEVVGNGDAGLFYGIQTLLQLARENTAGRLQLPVATIEDWPSFMLRFIHFDTKHHQDRMETLKRYVDWAARFKVNMIAYELEDKFEYPSNPVIGAPGAFTTTQLQELVDYGLERFIQIVPDIQAPAHMAYVLKHPQFAHLKADGNNYQSCLCDEETYDLIFSMYQDVINATKGVDYFLASTDEVYYAGICAKCSEPYNAENRSLKWVEFVRRARDFLHARGRRMISWVEYPVLAKDIAKLPPDMIDGVLGSDTSFIQEEKRIGLRQLVYTSMQGSEYLFPNYWSAGGGDFRSMQGRLWSTFKALSVDPRQGDPIGVFGAAWGDSGLHNEAFWLGWATVAQYGWTPGTPSVEQHVEDFANAFYGGSTGEIVEIYQGLQKQAQFYKGSWDRVVSRVRDSGYGNSYGPGVGVIRRDDTLPQPALPQLPGLDFTPVYAGRYGDLVNEAGGLAVEAQPLIQRIYWTMPRVERNRYNLEVFLSLARLMQHHDQMIVSMSAIEDRLAQARRAAESNRPGQAVEDLVRAYRIANSIVRGRTEVFADLQQTWEKSQYRKGREVDGRTFVHVLDDTKDHFADRRADLSYLVAPEESIGLEDWMARLSDLLKSYAEMNQVSIDSIVLDQEPEE